MRRCILCLMIVVLAGSLVWANGTAEEKPQPLRILLSDDMLEGGGFHALADRYAEETGIPVEVIEVPYADLQTKLSNMIRAGNSPNIVRTTTFTGFEEHLLDLTGIVDESIVLPARLPSCLYDGKLVAVPSNVTANGMLYNKSAFAEAGVAVPAGADDLWSWDEFAAAVTEVAEKTDVTYPLVWDHSQHRYATLLYQFGGSFFNEDISSVRIADDRALESLEFFLSLFDNGVMPKSVWIGNEDPSAIFKAGQAAVHMAGNWKIPDYHKNIEGFEWGAVLMPYAERRSSVLGGNFVVAIDNTGLEQETGDFLSWFYSPEVYTEYCEIGLYLPGRLGIKPDFSLPALSVFTDELANTPSIAGTDWGMPAVVYPGLSWGNALQDNIDLAIAGDLTAREALDAAEAVILDTFTGIRAAR